MKERIRKYLFNLYNTFWTPEENDVVLMYATGMLGEKVWQKGVLRKSRMYKNKFDIWFYKPKITFEMYGLLNIKDNCIWIPGWIK